MGARGPVSRSATNSAPRSAPGVPAAPAHITAAAAAEYHRTAELLADTIQEHDAALLATYAQAVADIAFFTEQLTREGHILTAVTGGRYLHPAHSARASAHKLLLATAAQLGLSPAARARIGSGAGQESAQASGPGVFKKHWGTGPA